MNIHNKTALDLFGKVTKETRAKAKAINFAELYSMGEIKKSLIKGFYP